MVGINLEIIMQKLEVDLDYTLSSKEKEICSQVEHDKKEGSQKVEVEKLY